MLEKLLFIFNKSDHFYTRGSIVICAKLFTSSVKINFSEALFLPYVTQRQKRVYFYFVTKSQSGKENHLNFLLTLLSLIALNTDHKKCVIGRRFVKISNCYKNRKKSKKTIAN